MIVLVVALLGLLGIAIRWHREMFRLEAKWRSDTLHVSSAKDGPWVVTHLVLKDGGKYAVAALPSPVAIIDSRGERFTTNFLQSLTWIEDSGQTSSPPKVGDRVMVFYYVPEQSKPSKPRSPRPDKP